MFSQAGNPLIPMLLVGFIIYFIVIRPEKKKQKERKQQLENVKKNDHVVTTGGLHGTVVNIKQTTITLRVDDNVKLEIEKEAISTIKKESK